MVFYKKKTITLLSGILLESNSVVRHIWIFLTVRIGVLFLNCWLIIPSILTTRVWSFRTVSMELVFLLFGITSSLIVVFCKEVKKALGKGIGNWIKSISMSWNCLICYKIIVFSFKIIILNFKKLNIHLLEIQFH